MSYLGVPPFGQTVRTITESLATAGQTTFSPSGGYLPGYIDVFLNGSALGAADFTATNGSTVVLNVAAALNDEFKAIAYWPVSLIDTYRKAEADALLAARVGTTSSVSMRNRIINGDMRIDQRNNGASVAVTTGNPGYGVDRFVTEQSADSVLTVQQVADAPPGFTNSLKVTVSTPDASIASTQYAQTQHKFEGFNVADLGWGTANAQTVTVSFWVKSSVTGQYPVRLLNPDGSRSFPFYITVNAANTWEYKTKTVVGPTNGTFGTNNSMAFALGFSWATGSTYAGGTADTWNTTVGYTAANLANNTGWIATSGATFYITGVQLEAGTVATPFERRDYGRELMMCQRYLEYPFAAARGASYGSILGVTASFAATKRATPTVTFASLVQGENISGNPYVNTINISGFQARCNTATSTGGDFSAIYKAESEL